jgi:hypothetical protein
VYDSLKQSAGMPEEVLEYFSQQGGQHLLYELRFLPVAKRAAPAIYMAESGSDQRVRGGCPETPGAMLCIGSTTTGTCRAVVTSHRRDLFALEGPRGSNVCWLEVVQVTCTGVMTDFIS